MALCMRISCAVMAGVYVLYCRTAHTQPVWCAQTILTQGSESLRNLTITVDSTLQKATPERAGPFNELAKVFSGHVLPAFTHLKVALSDNGSMHTRVQWACARMHWQARAYSFSHLAS